MHITNSMIFCKEEIDICEKKDIICEKKDIICERKAIIGKKDENKVKPRPKIFLKFLKKGDIIPSRHWAGLNIEKINMLQ